MTPTEAQSRLAELLKLRDAPAFLGTIYELATIAEALSAEVTRVRGDAERHARRLTNFIACIPPRVEGYRLTDQVAAKSLFALQDLVERTFKADAAAARPPEQSA